MVNDELPASEHYRAVNNHLLKWQYTVNVSRAALTSRCLCFTQPVALFQWENNNKTKKINLHLKLPLSTYSNIVNIVVLSGPHVLWFCKCGPMT